MGPWTLTRAHVEGARREYCRRLAAFLGFRGAEGWTERALVRRIRRVTSGARRRWVTEEQVRFSRREDVERLARFLGLHPQASWRREKLDRRVWRLVDSRAVAPPDVS